MLQNILNDPDSDEVQMVFRILLIMIRISEIVFEAKQEGKL